MPRARRARLAAPQLSRDEAEAILEHVGDDNAALKTIGRCSTLSVSWRLAGTTAMVNLALKRFPCVLVLEKTLPAFDHRIFVRKHLVPIKQHEPPQEELSFQIEIRTGPNFGLKPISWSDFSTGHKYGFPGAPIDVVALMALDSAKGIEVMLRAEENGIADSQLEPGMIVSVVKIHRRGMIEINCYNYASTSQISKSQRTSCAIRNRARQTDSFVRDQRA